MPRPPSVPDPSDRGSPLARQECTLRAEAGAWPLWYDGEPVDPDAFDLPSALTTELDAWTARLDAVDGWFDDPGDMDDFDRDGFLLWQRIEPLMRDEYRLRWRATFSREAADPPAG